MQDIKKKTKKEIQQAFIDRLHLRVDFPIPGGSGNTLNGNVARKLFKNEKVNGLRAYLNQLLAEYTLSSCIVLSYMFIIQTKISVYDCVS